MAQKKSMSEETTLCAVALINHEELRLRPWRITRLKLTGSSWESADAQERGKR
jgi:hypothetical protein